MEWKEVRLGDYIKTNETQYSIKENWENFVYLDTGSIIEGRIDKLLYFTKEDKLPSRARRKVQHGDIIYSCVRPNQRHYGYINIPVENLLVSTGFVVISCKDIDSKYLYYYLTQDTIINYLQNIGEQSVSTYPTIKPQDIEDIFIRIPSDIEDQRRIASILSSLDRKIELNNKINADLEEMAQAIFKNWFVDFEPFKDGKFVDSELGMIPEGWKIGSYSEMVDSLISGDWGKENPQGNYTHEVACVRGCDFQDINNGVRGKTPQRYILEKNYQAKHLKDKDILVEISGGTATVSTGRTSLVTEELLKKYKHDIVCTNFCKVLRPLSQFSSYVYYSWKYKYDNDIMFGYENGTSGIKNFAIKDFIEKEPVLIPKEQDIVEFQKIIDNLQKQKQIKGTENTTLSLLRDTLLPRLISGELEVPE